MDLPHHDDYWPGADYFIASDAPHATMFYPDGPDSVPVRFAAGSVVRYDALTLHSAPGFCPAAGRRGVTVKADDVVRTFVRVLAWDPLWSLARYPQYAALLQPAPAEETKRPETCSGEDVVRGCFDEAHPCERCCDLSRGPNGDGGCWAGWMSYQKCCGPASRRWGGCAWRNGADLWAHEYYSLEPPRLHSAAQCQQRCAEDALCGGWTYFRAGWRPPWCLLPLAAVIGLRRVCTLRASAEFSPTPHQDLIFGPVDCPDGDGGCLERGFDRLGQELAFIREIPSPSACRARCRAQAGCRYFAYYPESYAGDTSPDCVLPPSVTAWWETRCLLKAGATNSGPRWYLDLGDVVSGTRSCAPATPWLHQAYGKSRGALDAATDGDYRRETCVTGSPWRVSLDAAYVVHGVTLWFGDLDGLQQRVPRRYEVFLVTNQGTAALELCGSAVESRGGGPQVVSCGGDVGIATAIEVRGASSSAGFSLCEVEINVGPVPCSQLPGEVVQIHSHEVRIFPRGTAVLVQDANRGEACERRGGVLVRMTRDIQFDAGPDGIVCVETACAPSSCIEAFDESFDYFRDLSLIGLRDPRVETAADTCVDLDDTGVQTKGKYFEATVLVYGIGGQQDMSYCPSGNCGQDANGRGGAVTMHWGFCAPAICTDDEAARGAARLAASTGVAPSLLPPGAEVEFRNVRALGRWEDVQLDFLIAGFARSGTHSTRGNLANHPQVVIAEQELTFNWAFLPLLSQLQGYEASFPERAEAEKTRVLFGGKGEGVALSPRILGHLARVKGLKLVVLVREPVEWLESLYNLRAYECHVSGDCGNVPSLADVILGGAKFADVDVEDVFLSRPLEQAAKLFMPSKRLLILEFALLRERPQEFFDRLTAFLGVASFPQNYSFGRFATEDRQQYNALNLKTDLCAPALRPALDVLRERLRAAGEHLRLAQLVAASSAGSPWISSRLVAGRSHCD
eukprot:TRINITY_DN45821_c0_g1_i1.p1 TRINITY_DN45821_c0_g1~~TRINITY_DN45821_c0_g1_i1.p1  ORF type:complete len:1094 (+),score=161.72 TRINITY_DN45821_c0_g1_i1:390-3284(+)